MKCEIGIIGFGVMGQNLAFNLSRNNYYVSIYDTDVSKMQQFSDENQNKKIIIYNSIEKFVNSLSIPRIILVVIPAGIAVDDLLNQVIKLLNQNDIILDGGNSHFSDTLKRYNLLRKKQIYYMGIGISGGAEGARFGPSIMVGGDPEAWTSIQQMFTTISAKAEDGSPCCELLGPNAAGHYIKMVHNGIEYSDMQIISEIYDFLNRGLKYSTLSISEIFNHWNQSKLESYLIEITSIILKKIDENSNQPLIQLIMDTAEQKGTGKWTCQSALDLGISVNTIGEAVFQRNLSSNKQLRIRAAEIFTNPNSPSPTITNVEDKSQITRKLENSLSLARIISHSQGFDLLKQASKEYKWSLKLDKIALVWRSGCIIRSFLLNDISKAYSVNSELDHLLFYQPFIDEINKNINDLRYVIKMAIDLKISVPGLASALFYLESLSNKNLPTNLIQAQRDYFGSHGYKRNDDASNKIYHTDWNIKN